MSTRERPGPKYRAIASDLRDRIRSGEWTPGAALPSQRQLSAGYGVTLATLRQALDLLEADGLLTQEPGRGTFVAGPRAAYRLDSLRSLADDLRAQRHTVGTEILGQALRRPPAWVAAQLGVTGAGRALRLERLRLINGRPALHQVSWVCEPTATGLRDTDFSAGSLYDAIADTGAVVHRATETLRLDVLREPVAGLLRQPVGTPVFVSDRTTHGLDETPIVFDRATILGSAMEIRAERSATRLSLQWTPR